MLSPGAIFELKIHQNAFSAGALTRTPPRELTALPRPPSWFSWGRSEAGERKGERGREGKEGKFTV